MLCPCAFRDAVEDKAARRQRRAELHARWLQLRLAAAFDQWRTATHEACIAHEVRHSVPRPAERVHPTSSCAMLLQAALGVEPRLASAHVACRQRRIGGSSCWVVRWEAGCTPRTLGGGGALPAAC